MNVTKLPSGNFRARVYLGRDANGKQQFKSFTADKEWKVLKAAEEYLEGRAEEEKPTEYDANMTVGQAIDGYINLKRNVLSPTTIKGYENIRKKRLSGIMRIKAAALNNLKLQKAVNDEAKTLSSKSLKDAKCLIISALRLYGFNTAFNVTLPPKVKKHKSIPSAPEVMKIIKGTPVELPCLLAMWLSLRMSEVRGLKFKDLENGVLHIQRSKLVVDGKDVVREVIKTESSTRSIALPEYLVSLIESVPHKSDDEFIITNTRSSIYHRFKNLMKAHKIDMSFHDLRAVNASVMLLLGIPDKYAMERGGWSTPSVLKSVYQHTFSDERKLVDKRIDDYFNSLIVDTTVDTQ